MMADPKLVYELLLDHCDSNAVVESLTIGPVWTLCQNNLLGNGLAMTPDLHTRTLAWSGSLNGKRTVDIASWILEWHPYQAAVAMAAINSCINSRPLPDSVMVETGRLPNLAVFEHFLPQLIDQNVVVIGHYPGIECYRDRMKLSVLEKQPSGDDLPDAASEFLLPQADWVFITASSIPNKTFPRLAALASNAKTVLMGPTTPWLPALHEFNIDYLAGVEITDPEQLYHTVAQGGGVKIFEHVLRYRVAELAPATSLAWLKRQISDCSAERNHLSKQMENWYASGNTLRFPDYQLLESVNKRLSRLDSSFKSLWDCQQFDRIIN